MKWRCCVAEWNGLCHSLWVPQRRLQCQRIRENDNDKNTAQSVYNATIYLDLQHPNDCNRVKCWKVLCWPASASTRRNEWIVGIILVQSMQKMRLQQQHSPSARGMGTIMVYVRNGYATERRMSVASMRWKSQMCKWLREWNDEKKGVISLITLNEL